MARFQENAGVWRLQVIIYILSHVVSIVNIKSDILIGGPEASSPSESKR